MTWLQRINRLTVKCTTPGCKNTMKRTLSLKGYLKQPKCFDCKTKRARDYANKRNVKTL